VTLRSVKVYGAGDLTDRMLAAANSDEIAALVAEERERASEHNDVHASREGYADWQTSRPREGYADWPAERPPQAEPQGRGAAPGEVHVRGEPPAESGPDQGPRNHPGHARHVVIVLDPANPDNAAAALRLLERDYPTPAAVEAARGAIQPPPATA